MSQSYAVYCGVAGPEIGSTSGGVGVDSASGSTGSVLPVFAGVSVEGVDVHSPDDVVD